MTLVQSPVLGSLPKSRTLGQRHQSWLLMLVVSVLLLGGLGSRLVYLQLITGSHNRELADENRIRLLPRQPERGKILDRQGRILAGSRLSHSVFLWPLAGDRAEWLPRLAKLSQILKVPQTDLQKRLEQVGYNSPSRVRVARGLTPAQVTALAEYSNELAGVEVEAEAVRHYPHGRLGAHILGYTGEISDRDLERYKEEGYRPGDVIGQMGVESVYERQLRGDWGGQQIEVDSLGQVIRVLGEKPTKPGRDVQLTLDLSLQKAAEVALGDRKGAIVALDPNTGEVLAMVSRPAFDPNIFSGPISQAQWQRLQSQEYPFVNRALQGFPPASTFKIVTTTAALESGKFNSNLVLNTYPSLTVGGIEFGEWNRAGFGPLGFTGAMAWSSDTFFYQVAIALGDRALIDWTRRYGFGRKTGIELTDEETAGLVPDDAWKRREIKEGWYLGDTVNMSIGQGYLQSSPLQVAVMFAVPANGGYLVKPHLLKDDRPAKSWRQSLNLQPETLRILKVGLREVVTMGTGASLNIPGMPPIAGKSGTAEDFGRQSHTWFGAYAPLDRPQIVVVAFGENSGGGGGSVAGPMVRQVLEAYFNPNKPLKTAEVESVVTD